MFWEQLRLLDKSGNSRELGVSISHILLITPWVYDRSYNLSYPLMAASDPSLLLVMDNMRSGLFWAFYRASQYFFGSKKDEILFS